MGILTGLMGNATSVDAQQTENELNPVLVVGEEVQKAYKLIRDLIVFTDRRLIITDKQGITGSKVEYLSIPYKSITHFSIETGGTLDMDAELKIWVSGGYSVSKAFQKGDAIFEIHEVLSGYVLTTK
jgi:hypothetical protein